ncbi:unnamed protein product, partial [Cyprideis torosa]
MKRPWLWLALALISLAPAATAQGLDQIATDASLSVRSVQLILLVTVLSIAPALMIMVTCFPFIVTVLSILRQAIGLQQSPPNMLIISLALFLTYFVMEPVFTKAWESGLSPYLNEQIEVEEAFEKTLMPFRVFMAARMNPDTFAKIAELRPETTNAALSPDAP